MTVTLSEASEIDRSANARVVPGALARDPAARRGTKRKLKSLHLTKAAVL